MPPKKKQSPNASRTRDARILNEIIVDANPGGEQAMSWYYYLENQLHFPFRARCVAQRAISPLNESEEVTVLGMAPDEECEHEIFVRVRWRDRALAVPLRQLCGTRVDMETREAIADWHYWVDHGCEF